MPTGYTSVLFDKPETTFSEFASRCARAFGACMAMRDESLAVALPDEVKPETRSRHLGVICGPTSASTPSVSTGHCRRERPSTWRASRPTPTRLSGHPGSRRGLSCELRRCSWRRGLALARAFARAGGG